jgi:hypothetical protein
LGIGERGRLRFFEMLFAIREKTSAGFDAIFYAKRSPDSFSVEGFNGVKDTAFVSNQAWHISSENEINSFGEGLAKHRKEKKCWKKN